MKAFLSVLHFQHRLVRKMSLTQKEVLLWATVNKEENLENLLCHFNNIQFNTKKTIFLGLRMVAYICNPSTLGG